MIVVQDCMMEALADKTVVLVTHQVEFLPSVNRIVVSIMWEIRCWDMMIGTGSWHHLDLRLAKLLFKSLNVCR